MSAKPHLQIFNIDPSINSNGQSFTPFPRLPKELRLKIWRHAVQRERMITVQLKHWSEHSSESARIMRNGTYYAMVDGYQVLSKLLRINSESRESAMAFYRVHLPCEFSRRTGGPTIAGTLHLNPENDFLFISSSRHEIISFLYDLRTTYDPLHIGLLNLAVGLNDFNQLQYSDQEIEKNRAVKETLAQIHEVFIVSTEPHGRVIFPYWSGIPTQETIFNRSYPIMPLAPTFERLSHDPRPIDQDLKHVYLGTYDPRQMIKNWHEVLTGWGVSAPQIKYRFLLAHRPYINNTTSEVVHDRQSAEKQLSLEDNLWTGVIKRGSIEGRALPISTEKHKNEDLENAVRPAFGFWLFPLEALGSLTEEGVPEIEGFVHKTKQLRDMTGYWPELALSSLP